MQPAFAHSEIHAHAMQALDARDLFGQPFLHVHVDIGFDSACHGARVCRMHFAICREQPCIYKENNRVLAMDYYHRSDSMLFVPACFFIMIIVCGFAIWSTVPTGVGIPQVIRHVIILPSRNNNDQV